MNINAVIPRSSIFDTKIITPEIVKVLEIKEEELPFDMDYIEIMKPNAKLVREYFKKIAEELNKTIWK